MPAAITIVLISFLLAHIGYLHLQLYINRRIISALQETTVAAQDGERTPGFKPALAALGLLILAAGVILAWVR